MSSKRPKSYILYFASNGNAVWNSCHCFFCGVWLVRFDIRKIASNARTIDHLIPQCRGGYKDSRNTKWACHQCNHEKKAMTLAEYRLFKGGGLFWAELLMKEQVDGLLTQP